MAENIYIIFICGENMKKRIIALILIVVSITLSTTTITISAIADKSMEDKYLSVLQRMLYRDVIPEVQNLFGKYATIEISEINVVDIKFQVEGNDKLTLIVEPFTGPHDYIGKVEMVVMVGLYDTVVTSTKVLELY